MCGMVVIVSHIFGYFLISILSRKSDLFTRLERKILMTHGLQVFEGVNRSIHPLEYLRHWIDSSSCLTLISNYHPQLNALSIHDLPD
jgi:hypothetical protein